MKKFMLTSFLILTGIFTGFSQENFKPGYIVTQRGDTLVGLIDYRNWDKNPTKISFRGYGKSEDVEYAPLSILAFSVAGECYISEMVKVETSPYLLNDLKFDPELHLETEPAFLFRLVHGAKSLYHYKDPRGKDHFYIPTDSGMILLIHKTYMKEVDKNEIAGSEYHGNIIQSKYNFKTENKYYIGQLASYLHDCSAILPIVSGIEYTQTSLLKLFTKYQNNCNDNLQFGKSRKVTTVFGVMAGLSLNSLTWGKNESFTFSRTKYGYTPNLAAGLIIELKFRGNKWSINNEFLYAPFKVEGIYENYVNPERYIRIDSRIGSGYFKMNNMVRFRYPAGNIGIYVNAGISNSFGAVTENQVTVLTRNYGEELSEIDQAMQFTDNYELGFNFGLGIDFRNWSIEGRWEQGDGMSDLAALTSITQRYYILVGYRFNSNQN